MLQRRLLAGVTTLGLVAGGSAVAMAAASAPKHTTINAVTSFKVKINRYIQIGTRWQKDAYDVKSGGTITVVNLAASDGPHTFSVVKKSDLPRTAKQINNCKICGTIAQEHGVNPQSQGPPTRSSSSSRTERALTRLRRWIGPVIRPSSRRLKRRR